MAVYRGVVHGDVIVLCEPADLPEGAEVEVRPIEPEPGREEQDEASLEDVWEEEMLQGGLLVRRADPASRPATDDWTPIAIEGRPLSEQIIDERR